MKISLPKITLLGIDCVDLKRLQLAANICTKEIEFGSVKLLSSIKSEDPRVISIPNIKSTKDYSDFLIKKLDDYIDTEFVLIFQYDGFVLNPSAWLDEFLKYDYIGAPWAHLEMVVGNGGFSLRSKKLTSWLKNNWKKVKVPIHPEDVFIAKFAKPLIEKEGMRFASVEIASKFSKEGDEHSVCWNGEFGFHGIKYTDISRWLDIHPEYKNSLTYKLDDYASFMAKNHPVYTGTFHTLRFINGEMKDFKDLAEGKRNYVVRTTKEKYYDRSNIKNGDDLIFKRSGVTFNDFPVPAFERRVEKVEIFNSFADLRRRYPDLKIQFPLESIKEWKRPFVKYFGNWFYPKNVSYSVFWFS